MAGKEANNTNDSFISMIEAIQSGLIANFRHIVIETDRPNPDTTTLPNPGDYDSKSLTKLADKHATNMAAVEFYKNEIGLRGGKPALDKQGVVNCDDIQHALAVADLFNQEIKPELIDGKTACAALHALMSKKQRDAIAKDYKQGKILLLAKSELPPPDEVDIKLCLNLSSSRSPAQILRRVNPALRPNKKDPNKVAVIVDFISRDFTANKKGLLFSDVAGYNTSLKDIYRPE